MSLDTNMSLDKTSHPGRPGLDELVPSRYAVRVGEIDVPASPLKLKSARAALWSTAAQKGKSDLGKGQPALRRSKCERRLSQFSARR